MAALKNRDLPTGLRHLMTYWQAEEADIQKVHKMPEEEKVKEFLEWCNTDYAQESMNEQDKKDLQELLTKRLTLDDLPSGLEQIFLLYWQTEEATPAQKALPHKEKVEAFLQWCRQEDNFNWDNPDCKETAAWLTEHGYSRIPSESQIPQCNIKPNRLDEIFQLQGGVPVIGGLYIGMKAERAEEIVEELEGYKTEHSYDYPADLIFGLQISFEYQTFDDYDRVKQINVTTSSNTIFTFLGYRIIKAYLLQKYYHKSFAETTYKNVDGTIKSWKFVLYNDYYEYSLYFTDKGELSFQLLGCNSSGDEYELIYTYASNYQLQDFVKNSILICEKNAIEKKYHLHRIMPITYGLPILCGIPFGTNCDYTDIKGEVDNVMNDSKDYYPFSVEIMTDWGNSADTYYIRMPFNDDCLKTFISYLKKYILIEDGTYEVMENEEGEIEDTNIKMSNSFITVTIKRCSLSVGSHDTAEITIEPTIKDQPELYECLYCIFHEGEIISFFEELSSFYKNGDETQDGKINELRKKFDTFEDGLGWYIGTFMSAERDFGCYMPPTKKEEERFRTQFRDMWNSLGATLDNSEFHYY